MDRDAQIQYTSFYKACLRYGTDRGIGFCVTVVACLVLAPLTPCSPHLAVALFVGLAVAVILHFLPNALAVVSKIVIVAKLTYRLVDAQDQTRRLYCCLNGIDLHQRWLPYKRL